jgi:sodium/proline symporter
MTGPQSAGLLFGIGLYLVAILVVGFVTWRRNRSLDDFVLGGRRLSPFAAALSERASGESAWFLLGLPGAAYVAGFAEFWTVIGSSFGIFFSWYFVARLLNAQTRRLGALTIPDYLESRFGDDSRLLRVVAMGIILFFYTAYVGAQFVGAGKILNATFGLDESTGMLLGAVVVVFYTFMGGFIAVVWTDVVQGLLMMMVAVVLPLLGLWALGGPSELVAAISSRTAESLGLTGAEAAAAGVALGRDALAMTAGKAGWGFVNGVVLGGMMWGIGYLGQPHLLVRYMAIRSEKEVQTGRRIAVSWVLLSYWGAAFVGILAIALLPDMPADREQIMPLMALKLLPAWLAGLAIAGAIAAMMSTADSQLLVATSAVVEDVYVRLLRPEADAARLLFISRLATLAIAVVALLLAFRTREFVFDAVEYAWTGLASAFAPVLLLSLRWKGMTRWGALAGMIVGAASTVLWKNVDGLNALLDMKLACFLLGLAATVVTSRATSGGGATAVALRGDSP